MQTSLKLLIHYWPPEVYFKITHGIALTSCFLQIKPCRFAKANLWYLKQFWHRVVEFNLFFELTSQTENLKVPSKNFWKFCNFVLVSQEKDLDWYFMDIFEAEINGHVSSFIVPIAHMILAPFWIQMSHIVVVITIIWYFVSHFNLTT